MAPDPQDAGELLRFPVPISDPALDPGRNASELGEREALEAVACLLPDEEAANPRRDDVDAWGRSEHFRQLARKLGAFYYDRWFRVEWEGLEKIPSTGGALLIANHAGAIPPDAPMIMQGIETELGRPVYGLADYWFRTLPVVGTLLEPRAEACRRIPTTPTACCTTTASSCSCSPRASRDRPS